MSNFIFCSNYPEIPKNYPIPEISQSLSEVCDNSALVEALRQSDQLAEAFQMATSSLSQAYLAQESSLSAYLRDLDTVNRLYAPLLSQYALHSDLLHQSFAEAFSTHNMLADYVRTIDFTSLSELAVSIADSEPFISDILGTVSIEEVRQIYERGDVTDTEIIEEASKILAEKKPTLPEKIDAFTKTKTFMALQIIFFILNFCFAPVIDKVEDRAREALGINQFWKESGIYEMIDTLLSSTGQDSEIDTTPENDVPSDAAARTTAAPIHSGRENLVK